MARPIKTGLDYIPLDVVFFVSDEKVRYVNARFGWKGEYILIRLLTEIYKDKGYYHDWNEDFRFLLASEIKGNCTAQFIEQVVNESVKRGFFDKTLFDQFDVLTSRGIQKRYLNICKMSKRVNYEIEERFNLVSPGMFPEETEFPPEETRINPEFTQQSKSKVKGSKLNNSESSGITDNNFFCFDDFDNEREFERIVGELFYYYCGLQARSGDITRLRKIMEWSELKPDETWKIIVEAFVEFPGLAEKKRDLRYLLGNIEKGTGMIPGRICDAATRARELHAAKRKNEFTHANGEAFKRIGSDIIRKEYEQGLESDKAFYEKNKELFTSDEQTRLNDLLTGKKYIQAHAIIEPVMKHLEYIS